MHPRIGGTTQPAPDPATGMPSPASTGAARVRLVGWLAAAALLAALIHPPAGLGVPFCPSKWVTHAPCPGCGMTRSLSCAIRGQFTRSWHYHPFGPPLLGAIASAAVLGLLPRGPRAGVWTRVMRHRRALTAAAVGLALLMLAFGIARMAGLVWNDA
ncbi:MAG: DUF2752 domain-containing protein [Phycisphaerales bacterium]